MKQNPTLTGRSPRPHSPLWLLHELEILNWWLTVRDDLGLPHPHQPKRFTAFTRRKRSPRILVQHARNVMKTPYFPFFLCVPLPLSPFALNSLCVKFLIMPVWNTPAHFMMEAELANWWQSVRPVLSHPHLVAYWPGIIDT